MTKNELIKLATDATNDAELTTDELPKIDLYVDQIINIISDKAATGSEHHHSRVLTKTMINNYSKDGVISPVKGKKYTLEQLVQILFVYSLKSTLSIGEIKRLIGGAYEIEGFDADKLSALYDNHEAIKNDSREMARDFLNDKVIDRLSLDVEDNSDYITTICALVSMSAYLKNIAAAMIDVRFPEPIEEEEDKEKKKEEKDKAKEEKKEEKDKAKEEKKEKKKKDKESE